MMHQSSIERILDYALSHGGDFAEVYVEQTRKKRGSMLGDKLVDFSSGHDYGVGIRVFAGTEYYYCSSEDFDEAKLLPMMQSLLKKKQSHVDEKVNLGAKRSFDMSGKEEPLTGQVSLLKKCNRAGKSVSDIISQMNSVLQNVDQKVLIANTEGIYREEHRKKTRLFIKAYAKDGTETASSYSGPGALSGFEFYDQFSPEECAKRTAKEALSLLGGIPSPTGRMPVVIANGFGGLFFHEACGHSLEASALLDGCSEFSDLHGKQIASQKVTLIDDGRIPGEWGSSKMDDEGTMTRKNILIEQGVLKGCLTDRWNARKGNMALTGSGRRENYRYAPVSRMTNTYIAPGKDHLEQMIKEIDRGLYVSSINAGSVNPVTGEFNFNTSGAYMIENGILTRPVKSATLIGRGGDILKNVDAVADNFLMGQGFCYAESGAVFIGAGQPSVRISELTVGGNAK
ncbi:MAG: TldD/PmbA family protein [Lachnospiraceae bacterium]|nr:TldD/PmbA family protein [Lachnospiraceae bacterium]